MKRIYILSIAVLLALSSCKNNDEFTISGKVGNAGEIKKVLLYETGQIIDSAFLNGENEFKFKRVSIEPNFYNIVIGENKYLVIAKNGDELDFSADLKNPNGIYEIEGSTESKRISQFSVLNADFGKINQKIQEEYGKEIGENPEAKDSIFNIYMPRFQKNMEEYSKMALKFAEDNKENLAGFYAIGSIDPSKYETDLIKYSEEIKSKYPNNKNVQLFVSKMADIKRISIGQFAPTFESSTPDGKLIKLSDFKGKYVLLDFWASWCAPCRQENPNLVKQYNVFKGKNFTILGISLDDNKDAWVKAIKTDNLTWTQVSELNGWESKVAAQYKVEGIPASFLVDPSGKIIAKNLRAEELAIILKKVLL